MRKLGWGAGGAVAEREPVAAGGQARGDSYTLSEVAEILHVPLRSVLEWLEAGEIAAEQDPTSGRWRVPKSTLKGSEPAKQTEEELAWRYEKERVLLKLHEARVQADRERERANQLQVQVDGLRRELEVERMKGSRWRPFGGKDGRRSARG